MDLSAARLMTPQELRTEAHELLNFAAGRGYSNHVIRPLLAFLQGRAGAHGARCTEHKQNLLVVEEPTDVHEMLRPDDEYLDKMLEKLRFEAEFSAYLRGQGPRWN